MISFLYVLLCVLLPVFCQDKRQLHSKRRLPANVVTTRMISFLYVLLCVLLPVFCQVPPGVPEIAGPGVIYRGETIVLTCSCTGGDPTPTVKFFINNTEITDGISSSTSGSTVTTTFMFVATLNYHLKVIECQTDNGVLQNPLKRTKIVEMFFTPDIPVLTGPTRLVAGDPGTWTCTSANGYPAGTMTMKNINTNTTFQAPEYSVVTTFVNGGKSFTVLGTLDWSPALSNDNHQLCCELAHPTTATTPQSVCLTLDVRSSSLAVNAPVTSYTPTIGDSVTLQCVVTSGTATSITWFKGITVLNTVNTSRYSNGDVNNPSLIISDVQQSDVGDYACQASDGSVTVRTNNINVDALEKSSRSGQRGRGRQGTYDTPSGGESNPHFYDETDTYDRIPGQENISNDIFAVENNETRPSSSDYPAPIELYHKYIEVI